MDTHVKKGKHAAERTLEENFINSPPILIHQLVENYGLSVFISSFDDKGIAGYLDFDERWIIVNKEDSFTRQNFTIAHELGHWIMHHDLVKTDEKIRIVYRRPVGEETNPREIEANAFAAYLLVPDTMLDSNKDKTDLQLSQLFNVSQSVIGYRKKNLNGYTQGETVA